MSEIFVVSGRPPKKSDQTQIVSGPLTDAELRATPVPITAPGTVSTANASTTPLGISATFTGTFEDISAFAYFTLTVFADQASATDGLKFDWSTDGTNIDRTEASNLSASSGRAFAITPRARYFRVRLVNGVIAQTVLRIGLVLHQNGTGLISRPLDEVLNEENLVQTVRAVLSAKPPSGNFVNIGASAAGNLNIAVAELNGTISTDNSSTATLLSGATFTGVAEEVINFASICVSVFSNVASASSGLSLQFSSDGTNWDVSYPFTVGAGTGRTFKAGIEARYFRVVYTNGGTSQASFRLQTVFSPVATKHFGVPIDTVIQANDNAQLVKSVITGVTSAGGGGYVDVKVNPSGTLETNTNIDSVGGGAVDIGIGASSAGTQRVSVSIDDIVVVLDKTTTADYFYVGKALSPATATSASSWRIIKYKSDLSETTKFADGNSNFDNIWDNRASLTYT